MSERDQRLPIKVVVPSANGDYASVAVKPRQWPAFADVTPAVRSRLATQAEGVGRHFARIFPDWGAVPAVAKLTLIPEAVAKTYRPTAIFEARTCPIIGTGQLGELYVSVTPDGVNRLADRLRNSASDRAVAHISTIQKIEPFQAAGAGPPPARERAKRSRPSGSKLRCRLFQHPGAGGATVDQAFRRFAETAGVATRIELMSYSAGLRVYCLHGVPPEHVPTIRAHPAVEDLTLFPEYRIVRSMCHPRGTVTAGSSPPPRPEGEYGLVGQIDTGTDPNNRHLQAWVVARWDWVGRDVQDNTHGSFVAGTIIHGRALNHHHEYFPSVSSRIVDVVAIDRDGTIDEYDLLTVIDGALARYPQVRVWNLSLGRDTPCTDAAFSPLAMALDERMRQHDVVFVIAAGNHSTAPLRRSPAGEPASEDGDRICPPADAQRGVTVGGLAHLDNLTSCMRRGEPSPFARRGPAPAFGTKPDVAYPAGNCDPEGRYAQTGILSVDGSGNIAESIGTSYATPLASSLLANLIDELRVGGEVTPIPLAKALMTHSALLRHGPPTAAALRHRGVGCPLDLPDVLHCRQSAATLIFEVPLTPRPGFVKRHFPIPPCLVGAGAALQCEILMTLYYDPPLDPAFDFEYCRSNVEASLGTVRMRKHKGDDAKAGFQGETRLVPVGINKAYPNEAEQIEHGFKWSPLKLYYRRFTRGPAGKVWELRLDMLNRSGFTLAAPINVFLILTLRALRPGVPVYDELVREMARLGWAATDLQVRSRERI